MRPSRLLLAALALAIVAGVAQVAQLAPPAGQRMTDAAEAWLASLSAEQKAKGVFPFDGPERTNWHFVPLQADKKPLRKSLRLQDMNPAQRELAIKLLKTGTSDVGFAQASTIMSMETILSELEKNGPNVRDPEWYGLTLFGTPSRTSRWGWRFEGHHLSINYTVDAGQVVGFTPAFFGANPAIVKTGPRAGTRALADVEETARALIRALPGDQRAKALQGKQFPEIEEKPVAKVGKPVGVTYAELAPTHRELFKKLVEAYLNRLPTDVADAERADIGKAGWEVVTFAYAGGVEDGKPASYRLQGPTFVAEFLNVQADSGKNAANHIHSAWRKLPADFGGKL